MLYTFSEAPDIYFLRHTIVELTNEYSSRIFGYIEKWNTNGRTAAEAQNLLSLIMKSISPDKLYNLLKSKTALSLIPYTEKHFNRLVKAQQQLSLVQFLANED